MARPVSTILRLSGITLIQLFQLGIVSGDFLGNGFCFVKVYTVFVKEDFSLVEYNI